MEGIFTVSKEELKVILRGTRQYVKEYNVNENIDMIELCLSFDENKNAGKFI